MQANVNQAGILAERLHLGSYPLNVPFRFDWGGSSFIRKANELTVLVCLLVQFGSLQSSSKNRSCLGEIFSFCLCLCVSHP